MESVLLYHAHTPESNRVSQLSEEYQNLIVQNHSTDVYDLFKSMPDQTAPIMARTEHHYKRSREDKQSWHREFEEDIRENGDQIEYHEKHISGTIDGTPFAVIDGVEASYKDPSNHFLAVGLDLDEEVDAREMSRDELYELGESSEVLGFPHLNVLTPSTDEKHDMLRDLDDEPDIDVLLSRTGGYGLFNEVVNGKTPYGIDVDILASKYGLETVPELDLHSYVTTGIQYAGITGSDPIENLREGRLNPDDFEEFDRIESRGVSADLSDTARFFSAQVLPSMGMPHPSVETVRDRSYNELDQVEEIL